MKQTKIRYEVELIPYEEAQNFFESETDLRNALREGAVVAFGDYFSDPECEIPGPRVPISAWCWINYSLIGDTLSGGVDEHGSDDPEAYRNIHVQSSSINQLKTLEKKGKGRNPAYDWDSFWREIAFSLYKNGSDPDEIPLSLRDWARNIKLSGCEYIWGAQSPSETTLEDKLRPLFDAIQKESDQPLKTAALKMTISGSR